MADNENMDISAVTNELSTLYTDTEVDNDLIALDKTCESPTVVDGISHVTVRPKPVVKESSNKLVPSLKMSSAKLSGKSSGSTQSKILELKAKLAESRMQEAFEEEERQIETQHRELEKHKKEVLRRKHESILQAQLEVYQHRIEQTLVKYGPDNSTERNIERAIEIREDAKKVNTSAHEVPQESEDKGVVRKFHHEAQVQNEQLQCLKMFQLPKVDLVTFYGDVLQFNDWITNFELMVENSTEEQAIRLHFLKQYTSDIPHQLVSGFSHKDNVDSYQQAKEVLVHRYGESALAARAYTSKIETWPQIRSEDTKGIEEFSAFLLKCSRSMTSVPQLYDLNTTFYLHRVTSKLPVFMQSSWVREVVERENRGEAINFKLLATFVEKQARIVNHPDFSLNSYKTAKPTELRDNPAKTGRSQFKALTTMQATNRCGNCGELGHNIDHCSKFVNMSLHQRRNVLQRKGLCFNCLQPDHRANECRSQLRCKVCTGKHSTLMHDFSSRGTGSTTKSATVTTNFTSTEPDRHAMNIIKVKVYHGSNPLKVIEIFAAFDAMSTASFITDSLRKRLDCSGNLTEIAVRTITGEAKETVQVIKGLHVKCMKGKNEIALPKLYTQHELPFHGRDIPTKSEIQRLSHLQQLASLFPEKNDGLKVDMMIGVNCTKALQPISIIPGIENQPYGIQTQLGWMICGPLDRHESVKAYENVVCLRTVAHSPAIQMREVQLSDMIKGLYNSEYVELQCDIKPSHGNRYAAKESLEDRIFLELMKEKGRKIDGHYQLPLPFRDQYKELPNNRQLAVSRLNQLQRRFVKDKNFAKSYSDRMNELITKGYAERAGVELGRWYLPHHAVVNLRRSDKIRIVFDCNAVFQGHSLNSELMQGPTLMNSLIGVLIRFRQRKIATVADIEAMYYQVKIPPEQRKYLRFLWWPEGDMNKGVQEYQLSVHAFGCISSPTCAIYALKQTAKDCSQEYESQVIDTVLNNFYVDDLLISTDTTNEMSEVILKVAEVCNQGGFRLTKFLSNNDVINGQTKEWNDSDPPDRRDTHSAKFSRKILGIEWDHQLDQIGFDIKLHERRLTKRHMIAELNSIYDPLGLISPFLLAGKRLFSQVCNDGKDWDEDVDDKILVQWTLWKQQLEKVNKLTLNRCYVPLDSGPVQSHSLHHFSDASDLGYGQCSYLRSIDVNGMVTCSLVFGKSRVWPRKQITIPKKELIAATAMAKIGNMLRSELDCVLESETFWTDSKVVLGYVTNKTRKFDLFIANRIQIINECSKGANWKYVRTKDNPADDASRGMTCRQAYQDHQWFAGPSFLWKSQIDETRDHVWCYSDEANVNAVEVVNDESRHFETSITTNYSSWTKTKRILAYCLRFIQKSRRLEVGGNQLCVDEIEAAERILIKYAQASVFTKEIKNLTNHKSIAKSSQLYRYDVFLDDRKMLRIGGRLCEGQFNEGLSHPIILPKQHHVTTLILKWCHEIVQHAGRGFTLNEVRSRGFWIIKGNAMTRTLIYKCVTCRRIRGKLHEQKLAKLPIDHVYEGAPFTYSGVDFFGPFIVKEGRKEQKRYGCIFTCLSSRAVHIELTRSLDTSSFINALRRFIARRGNVRQLRSDRGTNIVGAATELKKALEEMNDEKIQEYLTNVGADYLQFRTNPPYASHMGGIWERQIQTVKKILNAMMIQHPGVLDEEGLTTLFAEVEAIINSRPITTDTLSDPESMNPLTPNHLLTLKTKYTVAPPGKFECSDVYCRRRWRRVQYCANLFWSRWRKEFIQTLQARHNAIRTLRDFQIGDIVLSKSQSPNRNEWELARIIKVHPSTSDHHIRRVSLFRARTDKERVIERSVRQLVLLLESQRC